MGLFAIPRSCGSFFVSADNHCNFMCGKRFAVFIAETDVTAAFILNNKEALWRTCADIQWP
jgi:hypothetical protein